MSGQAETDCKVILSLMGKEPYLAKGHVEDGEYQWTVVADKVSVTEMLRAALATPSPQALRHGVNCEKKPHVHDGYLHGEEDDTPYDVDGVKYCGRCHIWLDAEQAPTDIASPSWAEPRKTPLVNWRDK